MNSFKLNRNKFQGVLKVSCSRKKSKNLYLEQMLTLEHTKSILNSFHYHFTKQGNCLCQARKTWRLGPAATRQIQDMNFWTILRSLDFSLFWTSLHHEISLENPWLEEIQLTFRQHHEWIINCSLSCAVLACILLQLDLDNADCKVTKEITWIFARF